MLPRKKTHTVNETEQNAFALVADSRGKVERVPALHDRLVEGPHQVLDFDRARGSGREGHTLHIHVFDSQGLYERLEGRKGKMRQRENARETIEEDEERPTNDEEDDLEGLATLSDSKRSLKV